MAKNLMSLEETMDFREIKNESPPVDSIGAIKAGSPTFDYGDNESQWEVPVKREGCLIQENKEIDIKPEPPWPGGLMYKHDHDDVQDSNEQGFQDKAGVCLNSTNFTELDIKCEQKDIIQGPEGGTTGDQTEKTLQCMECMRSFKRNVDLQRHVKTHTRESPCYRCTECNKSYSRNEHLKRHIRISHSEEWPHQCLYCDKHFATRDALKQHSMLHVENREKCWRATLLKNKP